MLARGLALLPTAGSALVSPSALAQDTPAAEASTPDSVAADRAGGVAGSVGLETIVVTARRREDELQRAPLSVVALSVSDLEGRSFTHLRSLQNFVPNLTFAASQNVGEAAGNAFIRGIGQEDFLAGAEPGVGIYLDGVYLGRTVGTLTNLVDVARVEVLRGPQGTLYGRNAIGGAINLISTPPSRTADGYVDVIAGNLGRREARAMINAPLAKTLFVRLTAARTERDGYLIRLAAPLPPSPIVETNREPEGRDDTWSVRLQARWQASDSLTFDLAADASRRRGTQSATHVDAIDSRFGIFPSVNGLIRTGALPGPPLGNASVTPDPLTSYAGAGNLVAQDIRGVAATLRKDIGVHSVRLIAAYRHLHSEVATDLDGLYLNILENRFAERSDQYSLEALANGRVGRLDYTAGVFALRERTRVPPLDGPTRVDVRYLCGCFYTDANRPQPFAPAPRFEAQSYAAFAQGNLHLSDRLSATVGGRYSEDRKSIDQALFRLDPDTLAATGQVLASGANRGRWNSFTWRLGLEFQADADRMIYASAAKGYKSGGFNVRPVVSLPNLGLAEFAPETALTYEAGLRSEWFGRRLRLNLTVFQTSYRDVQLRQTTFVDALFASLIENAARARIRGIEAEAAARLSRRLTARLAYGHLDPRYLDVGTVPGLTLKSAFQRTPQHSLSASLAYEVPLGRHSLSLHGDFSYRSREQFQLLASPFDQPGYGLVGARATLRAADERWSFSVFGTNLTDQRYRAAGRGPGITQVGIANSVIGVPRQVGVELKTEF